MANSLNNYDPITANSKIKFLQGSQADLNKFFANSGDANSGKAIEGAFYLTIDTHKLYIGRKSKTQVGGQYPVYPEQVSRGVTVVETTQELPNPPSNLPNPPTDAVETGELYYVAANNILAALRYVETPAGSGNWVAQWAQINAPTGINGITNEINKVGTTASFSGQIFSGTGTSHNDVELNFVQGDNITLTATNNVSAPPSLTITATDTTYKAGTLATAANTTNGGSFGLMKDNVNNALDSTINIIGDGTVAVTTSAPGTSSGQNTITVHGPTFTDVSFNNLPTGFDVDVNYTSGDNGIGTINTNSNQTLDPIIAYGVLNGAYEVTNNDVTTVTNLATLPSVHFQNGTATLPVYTKEQTDYKIKEYVNNELSVADAMTYKGTIESQSAFNTLWLQNHKNGDTYKVVSSLSGIGATGAQSADIGDLIIFKGTEGTNGYITSSSLSIDIIPAGDEQLINPDYYPVAQQLSNTYTQIRLIDSKHSDTAIMEADVKGDLSYINVNSATADLNTTGDGKKITVNVNHNILTNNNINLVPTVNTSKNFQTTTGSDTIGQNIIKFYAIESENDITIDGAGHVHSITGNYVTLQHNKLTGITSSYTTANSNTTGLIEYTFSDTLGSQDLPSLSMNLRSDSLRIDTYPSSGTKTALTVDLVWGNF